MMPFDDGSVTADKAQSSATNLLINYAEPAFAAGTAVFGLGILVLPLLARLNGVAKDKDKDGRAFREKDGVFSYRAHGEANTKQPIRLFTEAELRQRLGLLDAAFLLEEITMSTDELDERLRSSSVDATDDEVNKIQKWRDKANGRLRALQKRSALAFLGLHPDAVGEDVSKMYKKMALELHPDKGGDPEKFQELQEMKDRLNDIDREDDKKDDEDPEDEEARKAKEKEKEEEEEEKKKQPANERVAKLRMDAHDNTVRVWDRARKAKEEIIGDKCIKSNPQPALNLLRMFVDRFVTSEIKTLRHDDSKGAEAKFRKFLKQGAEIIAVAALADVQATLSTIAMHFNYRLVARSGSAEIKNKCAALLEAIAEVPLFAESFIKEVEMSIMEQKDRDRKRKEERAEAQRAREAAGDYSGDAGSEQPKAKAKAKGRAEPKGKAQAKDPFSDFDFADSKAKMPEARAPPSQRGPVSASEALKKKDDEAKSAIAAANAPKPSGWDPAFDHPYAGALKSNGTGIYCRPCQRWIMTYEYNIEVFNTHVERAHSKPPPGFGN